MVSQCFDSLNIYGKEPEQLENTILMFAMALEDQEPDDIKKAFVYWVKNNSQMPTPADILGVIESTRPSAPQNYFQTTTEERQAYLEARKQNKVYWFGRSWLLMDEKTKSDVKSHIRVLQEKMGKDRAEDYCKFLRSHADAPKDLYKQIFQ